jgi:hypothetical protein
MSTSGWPHRSQVGAFQTNGIFIGSHLREESSIFYNGFRDIRHTRVQCLWLRRSGVLQMIASVNLSHVMIVTWGVAGLCRNAFILYLTETLMSTTTQVSSGSRSQYKAKAYSAASAESPLTPTTIPRRDPGERDVQIEILFCGICHSDLHQQYLLCGSPIGGIAETQEMLEFRGKLVNITPQPT